MSNVLKTVKKTGKFPESFESKEETNTLGPSNVSESQLMRIRRKLSEEDLTVKNTSSNTNNDDKEQIKNKTSIHDTLFVIVDGIMLYHDPTLFIPYFDLCIFIRSRYNDLKTRRENRAGYVTLDGFWKDPPGYFDQMVWPGYVRAHSYLFDDSYEKNKDKKIDINNNKKMESQLSQTAINEYHLKTPDNLDYTMCQLLDWAVDRVLEI